MIKKLYSQLQVLILGKKREKDHTIQFWREQVFFAIALSVLFFGSFAYIFSIIASINEKLFFIGIFDTLIYILAVLLVLNNKITFKKRVYSYLFILYLIGVFMLIALGKDGAGHTWLFAFPAMASIMIGLRAAIIALIINFFTLSALGIAIVYLHFIPSSLLVQYSIVGWVAVSANFLFLNVIVTLPIGVILKGLVEEIIKKEQLQQQLYHAQKMEAIGTLAGGVAHDLNNVLSAQIGYPDLILMDLPENSPLKDPILRIQESGQKAAAIVQDLLTMARRGVIVTDVINLNQVIDNYLSSLECEKLELFNSDIRIKSNPDADLLNIMGSTVHLSKAVMNLVNNAAEAMPHGGDIIISTQNRYIDKPLKGYESIKEGDYAVLKVADTGTGIAAKDIERIFEPFYTKKKMGRSGTGLGMAVVWGTIKDHQGYVNVQSTRNKGTVFTLYFPVTREEISEEKTALSMKEYMGQGESILVVDYIETQRKIASDMLEKLGYLVKSLSSGEQAVNHMKKNLVDLIILDMIMDRGIDGCEAYKQILALHPEQKAIITSGFSETDRVKEAQRLGAGEYIKKPYTFEKLGFAVKKELGE